MNALVHIRGEYCGKEVVILAWVEHDEVDDVVGVEMCDPILREMGPVLEFYPGNAGVEDRGYWLRIARSLFRFDRQAQHAAQTKAGRWFGPRSQALLEMHIDPQMC
ncbi:MAG: hypothetical protein QM811_16850 [Pirellulales bacterium]